MIVREYLPLFPRRTRWPWWLSALAGATGLALTYGFPEPIATDEQIHRLLIASGGLFLLSRVLLLIPPVEIPARVGRCWLDFAVLLAGVVWWALDHGREREVLEIIAAYSAAAGLVAALAGGEKWLTEGLVPGVSAGPVRRLFLAGLFVAIVGGLILSLPNCWSGAYPVSLDGEATGKPRYEYGMHGLNCLFTATSALTGTGLTVHDIGRDYTLAGQIVILLLMQLGGLVTLAVGMVVGLRLRAILGWQTSPDDTTPQGLRQAVKFSILLLLAVEFAGAAALFFSQPDLFRGSAGLGWEIMRPVFHAVSAFCGVGLTLNGESMVEARGLATTYAVILPLMVLGSIGGPTLYALCRKLRERTTSLPAEVWFTLGTTVLLVAVGAGLLYGIESSYRWQLRYPQENTPGSLQWGGTSSAPAGEIVFSSSSSDSARSKQMRTMSPGQRIGGAVFQSVSARSSGMRTARLDEHSISPASRIVLATWMFVGGSVGGTAGGVRLCVVGLLLAAILRPRRRIWRTETDLNTGPGRQALAAAGAVVAAMILLIFVTTLVLTYRQSASLESCLFESISACTNSGLSANLTNQLPLEDKISGPWQIRITGRCALILAMILGRVLPVAILLRWSNRRESA